MVPIELTIRYASLSYIVLDGNGTLLRYSASAHNGKMFLYAA